MSMSHTLLPLITLTSVQTVQSQLVSEHKRRNILRKKTNLHVIHHTASYLHVFKDNIVIRS